MIPLMPTVALAFFSLCCSAFIILRIIYSILPRRYLGRRVYPVRFLFFTIRRYATERLMLLVKSWRLAAQVPIISLQPTRVMCGWHSATSLQCPCLSGRRSTSGSVFRQARAQARLLSESARWLGFGWPLPSVKRVFLSSRPSS